MKIVHILWEEVIGVNVTFQLKLIEIMQPRPFRIPIHPNQLSHEQQSSE